MRALGRARVSGEGAGWQLPIGGVDCDRTFEARGHRTPHRFSICGREGLGAARARDHVVLAMNAAAERGFVKRDLLKAGGIKSF